jgi:NADH-quinone oxidoreductase subunit N
MVEQILALLPISIIIVFSLIAMLTEVSINKNKEIIAYISIIGLVFASLSSIYLWKQNQDYSFKISLFNNMLTIDNYSIFFYLIFFLCSGITIFISVPYLKRESFEHGEYYSLILMSLSGMMLMVSSNDLIIAFLGIEIMSIAVYVLVGFIRTNIKSNEAILKYFFLGSFSAGFILYGIAMIYGYCGTINFSEINTFLQEKENTLRLSLINIGAILILIGTLFKVAAFPFHVWLPDVYEGSPSPITGFMITAVKVASFGLFIKLVLTIFYKATPYWIDILSYISIFTMFVGNLFAFTQENIKKMLAYSSISHTGYLLIGLSVLLLKSNNFSLANSLLFYLVSYSISSLGIFACISYISSKGEKYSNIEDYSGIGFKYPLIGITMSISMLSLIGFPPTSGFFAKYYLFSSAIKEGMGYLVLIGIINSMLSIYYYLKVISVMYLKEFKLDLDSDLGKTSTKIVMLYTAIATIWLGIGTFNLISVFPGFSSIIQWSELSIKSLF